MFARFPPGKPGGNQVSPGGKLGIGALPGFPPVSYRGGEPGFLPPWFPFRFPTGGKILPGFWAWFPPPPLSDRGGRGKPGNQMKILPKYQVFPRGEPVAFKFPWFAPEGKTRHSSFPLIFPGGDSPVFACVAMTRCSACALLKTGLVRTSAQEIPPPISFYRNAGCADILISCECHSDVLQVRGGFHRREIV